MIKRVVHRADCKWCMADEHEQGHGAPGVYIGESSRQVGTRVMEHLTNLHQWKKESFIIDPRMQ